MQIARIIIILSFSFFCSTKCIAQDEEIVSTNKLFEFFTKLDNSISSLVDKQKAKRLYRHLDYFKNDMNRYLIIRKEITSYLETKNYSSFDTLRVQEAVLNLEIRIIKIGKRLETIKIYVNETLSDEIDNVFDEIDTGTQQQQEQYINKLQALSNGQKIDKKQLRKDGATIYKNLENSIRLINKVKNNLKTRFSI